jgi:hypothetical protein
VARQCVGLGLLEVDDATGEYRPTEAGLATVEGGAPVMLAEELARRRGALTDGLPAWRVAVWESLVAARRGMAAASGRLEHEIVGDAEMAALVAGAGAEALAGRADPAFVARATAVLESARPPDAPAALDTGLF